MPEKVAGVRDDIGCCGLACSQCRESLSGQCRGCGQKKAECSIRKCCQASALPGCWDCGKFPCAEGMFSNPRVRAFVQCAKEDGVEKLAEYLRRNRENGIAYHKDEGLKGDYDGFAREADILRLLRTGAVE